FSRDWSSDVCSSDLVVHALGAKTQRQRLRSLPAEADARARGHVEIAGLGEDAAVALEGVHVDPRLGGHRQQEMLAQPALEAEMQDRKSTRLNSSHVK